MVLLESAGVVGFAGKAPPSFTRVDEAEQKPRSGAGDIGLLPVCLPHAAFIFLICKETLCLASSLFVIASVLVGFFSTR